MPRLIVPTLFRVTIFYTKKSAQNTIFTLKAAPAKRERAAFTVKIVFWALFLESVFDQTDFQGVKIVTLNHGVIFEHFCDKNCIQMQIKTFSSDVACR